MSISDIITVISIIIAIFAIISLKERKSILLKFNWVDIIIYIVITLLVIYLILFSYCFKWGAYLPRLIIEKGLPSNIYAFFVTIGSLFYFEYKVLYAFYPKSNKKALLAYYNRLVDNQEYLFLLTRIEKYHVNDIIKYLRELYLKKKQNQKRKIMNVKRIEFAELIFNDIVCRHDFIINTANQNPYFFADLLKYHNNLTDRSLYLLEDYLNTLIKSKNSQLIQGFKQAAQVIVDQYKVSENNRIIFSFMRDLKTIEDNYAWKPFGESAINEIRNEKFKKPSSFFNQKYHTDGGLWNYRTHLAITFFDMVLRKAICLDYKYHMWLFYYYHIVDTLFDCLEIYPENSIDLTDEFPTNIHRWIYEIISHMSVWLKLVNETGNLGLLNSICACLGRCICSITLCPDEKIGTRFKRDMFSIIFEIYFGLQNRSIRSKLEQMLIKPSILCDENVNYKNHLVSTWQVFDKVPYQKEQIKKFQNSIINKIT